jgi:hypothetical protein
MTRLANLIALRDAARTGDVSEAARLALTLWDGMSLTNHVVNIVTNHDMNAALAFHEAVAGQIKATGWVLNTIDGETHCHVYLQNNSVHSGVHEKPAVAMFLADMATLIAIEEGRE